MAIPAIIGLSALSTFFGTLLVKIIEFVSERLVKRLIMAGILITAIYAFIQTLMTTLSTGATSLIAMLPPWPAEFLPVLIPMGILKACIATIITGEIIVAFTAWGVWLIKVVKGVQR